ncbi:MAG: hypothetical protein U5L75_00890 [Candidatus Campbellbacteria bacterium]|nr:hypothetical protein [Candidatus Campbellbacteria bacterium]
MSSLFGFSFAQEGDSEDPNSGMPSGVSITLNDPNAGIEFEVAEELYLSPTFMEAEISDDGTTANLSVSVSSRISTEVEVRAPHEDLLVSGDKLVRIRAGSRIGVSFTAYAPHEGTVEFVNTNGEVVETINYVVTKGRSYRQSVSANVSHEGDVSARYGIRFDDGYGFNVNVSRDEEGDVTGGVSGSYSW